MLNFFLISIIYPGDIYDFNFIVEALEITRSLTSFIDFPTTTRAETHRVFLVEIYRLT